MENEFTPVENIQAVPQNQPADLPHIPAAQMPVNPATMPPTNGGVYGSYAQQSCGVQYAQQPYGTPGANHPQAYGAATPYPQQTYAVPMVEPRPYAGNVPYAPTPYPPQYAPVQPAGVYYPNQPYQSVAAPVVGTQPAYTPQQTYNVPQPQGVPTPMQQTYAVPLQQAYAPVQPVTQWVYVPVWNPAQPLPQPRVYMPPVVYPTSPEEIARRKYRKFVSDVRRRSNKASGFSLLYIGILSVCVTFAAILYLFVDALLSGTGFGTFDDFFNSIATEDTVAGFGYMLATILAVLFVFIWKKKLFFRNVLFSRKKRMSPSMLFILMLTMFAVQAIALINANVLELILNQIGVSIFSMTETSEARTPFMMLLYVGILAPFSEEVMFRGGVMRTLQPMGKRFAILASAILFAVMHGNMIQIPFAFVAGLIFGYVTVEYSMWWSIFLHTFNNLILAEGVSYITTFMPTTAGLVFQIGLIAMGTIGAVVVCIVKRRDIAAYLRAEKCQKGSFKGFFTSPFTIIMLAYALVSSLASIFG